MEKRPEIDYVSTADIDELAFVDFIGYLQGEKDVGSVPQLMYRDKGALRHNEHLPDLKYEKYYSALDQIPVVDRTLLPAETWTIYLQNYLDRYGGFHKNKPVTGVTTMNRARGCHRFNNPCTYCGIVDLTIRLSSPEKFWAEVRSGHEQVNANIFYEVFDNMASAPPPWLERVILARPPGLEDIEFFTYAEALRLDKKRVELFKRLGVNRLNMGLDSGNTEMLQRLKSPADSVEHNEKAVKLVKEAGMTIYASFVLGAPGENRNSLADTIEFAKWLVDGNFLSALEAQPLLPEFNAKAGRMLMNPEVGAYETKKMGLHIQKPELLKQMPEKWGSDENPDPDEIARDWASIFCEVDYAELDRAAEEISSYARDKGFGYGKAFF